MFAVCLVSVRVVLSLHNSMARFTHSRASSLNAWWTIAAHCEYDYEQEIDYEHEAQDMLFQVLNITFFIFHSLLILFILLGWVWRRTRKIHLVCVLLTAFSWFFLGLFMGFGYCPCTDWHWRVLEALGHTDLPNSYIKFLIDSALGTDANAFGVDAATLAVFVAVTLCSLYVSFADRKGQRPGQGGGCVP